jgi:uncharacterized protein YjhX (UPF0386 family)
MSDYRQQQAEVEWYQKFGRYQQRIILDRDGQPYVIGDLGWNKLRPARIEYIEGLMPVVRFRFRK